MATPYAVDPRPDYVPAAWVTAPVAVTAALDGPLHACAQEAYERQELDTWHVGVDVVGGVVVEVVVLPVARSRFADCARASLVDHSIGEGTVTWHFPLVVVPSTVASPPPGTCRLGPLPPSRADCCWEGQRFDEGCVGEPVCPPPFVRTGDGCAAPGSSQASVEAHLTRLGAVACLEDAPLGPVLVYVDAHRSLVVDEGLSDEARACLLRVLDALDSGVRRDPLLTWIRR